MSDRGDAMRSTSKVSLAACGLLVAASCGGGGGGDDRAGDATTTTTSAPTVATTSTTAAASTTGDASAPAAEPALALMVDMPDLRSGTAVSWPVTLANRGEESVALTFASGLDADIELIDAQGAVAYRWSQGRVFSQAIRNRSIPAGARWRFTPTGTLDVAPGTYTARVRLAARPAPPMITRDVDVDVDSSGPPPKLTR